ncbi:nucleotidyltransferase family protein [Chloroflexus aurantiacus]
MNRQTIEVQPEHLAIVCTILRKHVPHYDVRAFGSRVQGRARRYSDLDLVIMTDEPLALDVLAGLAEDFADSDLPWKVDIVDWATTDAGFRAIIARDSVLIQRGIRQCQEAKGAG